MGNPFAAIETALAGTVGALSNATARISGQLIDGIFDSRYSNSLDISSTAPAFTCATDALPAGIAYGMTVSITYKGTSSAYTLGEIAPDGAGITTMVLK